MKKFIVCGTTFLMITLYGADKKNNSQQALLGNLQGIPSDVLNYIFSMVKDTTIISKQHTHGDSEFLFLPTTTPIVPDGENISHIQLYKKPSFLGGFHIDLNNSKSKSRKYYYVEKKMYGPRTNGPMLFDGNGSSGITVVCYYPFSEDIPDFYLDVLSIESRFNEGVWIQANDRSYLYALALLPESNKFILSTQPVRFEPMLLLYKAIVGPKQKILKLVAVKTTPFSCKKLVCFSKTIYGAITEEGMFKTLHTKKHVIAKDKIDCINQNHGNMRFKDVAVNPTHVNKHNFRYRFALLGTPKENNTADIFICDLSECYKPTLLYSCTIPEADLVKHFYYEDDELRVVYRDENDANIITHIYIRKDNFSLLWFGYMLRHYGQKKE